MLTPLHYTTAKRSLYILIGPSGHVNNSGKSQIVVIKHFSSFPSHPASSSWVVHRPCPLPFAQLAFEGAPKPRSKNTQEVVKLLILTLLSFKYLHKRRIDRSPAVSRLGLVDMDLPLLSSHVFIAGLMSSTKLKHNKPTISPWTSDLC